MDLYFGEVHHATRMVNEKRLWYEALISKVKGFWIMMNQTLSRDHNRLCPWVEAFPRTFHCHCMVFSCSYLMFSHVGSKLLGAII